MQLTTRLVIASALCGVLLFVSGAEASVKVIRKDILYGVRGPSKKEISRQISQRGGAKITISFSRKIDYALKGPSTCYVREARHTLYLVSTYPRLEGEASPKLRKRWNALVSAGKASDKTIAQWAVQVATDSDALTARLSMKNDPSCGRLKSFVTQRIHSMEQRFEAAKQRHVSEQNGPNGAVGKATAELYKEP
ncbi:DUF922 domain-containing protein [Mesorhizobium qingshengii]|uniref:Predicted secreted Zn-dependent protease n=1 Tax=Mesorhizobium qingshengii TaxID=1165689 RepID=A0A1G5ZDA3_9HYPH|nr:DUF922 domain-containing protein [Mesorhizobium qingshengii]SDA92450.1 Predicted secreted Zn-dependent protease [Mesorhizobium qingshengii]